MSPISRLPETIPLASGVLLVFVLAAISFSFWQRKLANRNKLPLAPKPPGSPILGNLPEFIGAAAKGELHLLLQKWAEQYGDLFRVQLGPITLYYVCSDIGVKELFERNSAYTAERPRWIISNEQICNKLNVLLLNASDARWKHQRKAIHSGLTSIPMADKGLPFLHYETAKFLHEVANDPAAGTSDQNLWLSIGRYTYSAFGQQMYGMEVKDAKDPVIHYIFDIGEAQIEGTLPGSHIVDMLPILDKLPLLLKPWERKARARFSNDLHWINERLARVKKDIREGIFRPAFLQNVINDEKNLGFATEEEAGYLALQLIIGAADTSRISTWSFLEAMMAFPNVQEKAQQEIDSVVGDRVPVWEDLEKIPYVRCLMKELWRWRPPVALGHPHETTKELMYGGYRLPKGSRIHINAWAIGHNSTRHQDPERFWPERYADDHTTTMQSINSSDPTKRDHYAFGAGRRVCPGYHVAERSLAIAIMRVLWAFDIRPAPGTPLPLDMSKYRGFMPANPGETMPATLKVRNEKNKMLIDGNYAKEMAGHVSMGSLGG